MIYSLESCLVFTYPEFGIKVFDDLQEILIKNKINYKINYLKEESKLELFGNDFSLRFNDNFLHLSFSNEVDIRYGINCNMLLSYNFITINTKVENNE